MRKKFNGSWSGEFLLKDEDDLNISCKVEITIKNFNGYVNSVCKNIKYEVYLNINLERNLENSYILVFLQNKKLELNGDITSFAEIISARATECKGPAPPKPINVNPRGSIPLATELEFIARDILLFIIT